MSYPPPQRPLLPMMPPQMNTGQPPPPLMPPYGFPPNMMPPLGMPRPALNIRPPPPFSMMNMDPANNKPKMQPLMATPTSSVLAASTTPGAGGGHNEKAPAQPITTVFVGSISERVPDQMLRQMLQRCGNVLNWKRVQGTNGKLQAFGFCDYDSPDATLRCIRLLNGYELADKKLHVKVDNKTNELLMEHIKKQRALNADNQPLTKNARKAQALRQFAESRGFALDDTSAPAPDAAEKTLNLELVDEDTLREDRIIICAFELILKQFAKELTALSVEPAEAPEQPSNVVNMTTTTSVDSPKDVERASAPGTPDQHHNTSSAPASQTNGDSSPAPSEHTKSVEKTKERETTSKRGDERTSSKSDTSKEKSSSSSLSSSSQRERERERDRDGDSTHRSADKDKSSGHRRGRGSRSPPPPPASSSDQQDKSSRSSRTNASSTSNSSSSNGTSHRSEKSDSRRVSTPPRRSRSPATSSSKQQQQKEQQQKQESSSSESRRRAASPPAPAAAPRREKEPEDDSEEGRERRRLERLLREKEAAYRDRLKKWEQREEMRAKEYAEEKRKAMARHKQETNVARKMRKFFEDYDDAKDDQFYYKGAGLDKKLKIREKEIELDNRDRLKERDELDELKRRLMEKSRVSEEAAESEAKQLQSSEELKLKSKFEKLSAETESSASSSDDDDDEADQSSSSQPQQQEQQQQDQSTDEQNNEQTQSTSDTEAAAEKETKDKLAHALESLARSTIKSESSSIKMEYQTSESLLDGLNSQVASQLSEKSDMDQLNASDHSHSNSPVSSFGTIKLVPTSSQPTVSIKTTLSKHVKTIQPVNQLFVDEDDDQSATAAKRAKIPASQLRAESDERKKLVKKLVESIPTDRDELFAYALDWTQMDDALMEKRIRPWINKKIIEYIGEEEQSLNDFICTKIREHTRPDKLLDEVKVILDDEAELFVKKLWRLLVYETESKRCGLTK